MTQGSESCTIKPKQASHIGHGYKDTSSFINASILKLSLAL